jgi:hypothetical protein
MRVALTNTQPWRLKYWTARSCFSAWALQYGEVTIELEAGLNALANDRRLQILEWLKDPTAHFRPQMDGDLVKDGVCGVLTRGRRRKRSSKPYEPYRAKPHFSLPRRSMKSPAARCSSRRNRSSIRAHSSFEARSTA